MAIQFNNLIMSDSTLTYVFDGTAWGLYDLYPEL